MTKLKDQDVISGAILLLLAIPGFIYTSQIEDLQVSRLSGAFFPNVCFAVMTICGVILIGQALKRTEIVQIPYFNFSKLIPIIAVLAVYVSILEYIGFIISTIIFVFCAIYLFGERRKSILLTVPIITSVCVYFLFSKAFMITLPGLPELGVF